MSNFKETGLPCPCGESSDAFARDNEGKGFCFGAACGGKLFSKRQLENYEGIIKETSHEVKLNTSDSVIEYGNEPTRGLTEKTLEFFNIKTKYVDGEPKEWGFPYGKGWKVRDTEKNFTYKGNYQEAYLFGKERFDPGSRECITLTEGEWDAASILQVVGPSKSAVCSVRSSVTAHGDCAKEFDYINSFDKIVLCFDSDNAGKKAMDSVAAMFDFRKVYIVRLTRYKDANEYLQNDESQELYAAWSKSRRYSPENIISSFGDIENTLSEEQNERVATYPFTKLQDNLHGLHRGELVCIKAPEGVGKTSLFRKMEHHILKTEEHPIGVLHFEESNNETIRGIVTYELEQPASMEGSPLSNDDVLEAYKMAVEGREDRLFIRKSYDMDDIKNIVDNVRFMIAGCGCAVVFFDHISWLAVSENMNDDERKKLDALSQKLKLLAEELHACIVIISHINDDGKTRGSRYISKVSNTVISLERSVDNVDPHERNKTYFNVEKGRGQGTTTGPAGYAYYDINTYTLKDGVG